MELMLKKVRLGPFPNIWKARDYKNDGKFKYGVKLLFPQDHPAFKEVSDVINKVATEAWKGNAKNVLASIKGNAQKMCFLNGNLKMNEAGVLDENFTGCFYLGASSKVMPRIFDTPAKNPDTGEENVLFEKDGKPYGGCYVTAKVDIYAHMSGIFCNLIGLQFVADGDAFMGGGGRPANADDFEDLSDGADAPEVGMAASGGGGLV